MKVTSGNANHTENVMTRKKAKPAAKPPKIKEELGQMSQD